MDRLIATLQIGPVKVPIFEDPDLEDYGNFCTMPDSRIKISTRQGLCRDMTILHEVLHAISDHYGFRLSESQVRGLEQTLTQLVKDNPTIVKDWVDRVSSSS